MTTKDYGHLRSLDEVKKVVDKLGQHPEMPLAFDIETGYLGEPRIGGALSMHAGGFIVGFSFTVDSRWARYVPLRHDMLTENLDPDAVWPVMKPLLEQKRVVAHNAKFEKRYCRTVDIDIGILGDTMIDAYCLSRWESVGLKQLVQGIFGHQMTEFHELFPEAKVKERKVLRFNHLGLTPQVVAYACEDSAWCLDLHHELQQQLRADTEGVQNIHRLEMEVLEVLCDMEDFGVQFDWDAMALAKARAQDFILEYTQEVRAGFGQLLGRDLSTLNLNSVPQLRTLLYTPKPEGLGLPVSRMTANEKNPQASTDEIALTTFAKEIPAIAQLLSLRELQNLTSRFDNWLNTPPKRKTDYAKYPTRGDDGRTHPGYRQTVVGTGRFSAADPAIQQLPKDWFWSLGEATEVYEKAAEEHKDKLDKEELARAAATEAFPDLVFEGNFRDFALPADGYYFLGYDYSQIELRAIAGLAGEKSLLDAFAKGEDVHRLTAAMMLGKELGQVTEKDRAVGKTMNFALIYQMSFGSLGERLGIPRAHAQNLYEAYFANFPSIASWVERAKVEGKERRPPGTVSYFGRRAAIWELNQSRSRALYAKGERMLANFPVQGWAADYMKFAMVRVTRTLKDKGLWGDVVRMVMNQHDALVFEVRNDQHPREMVELMRPRVEFPIEGFPGIVSEWEMGYRYGSLKKFDELQTDVVFDGRWRFVGETGVIERDEEPETSLIEVDFHSTGASYVPDEPEEVYEPRTVIVDAPRVPFEEEVRALLGLVARYPGGDSLVLRVPGREVATPHHTCLSPSHAAEVSLALPGATVYYPSNSVDLDAVMEGM